MCHWVCVSNMLSPQGVVDCMTAVYNTVKILNSRITDHSDHGSIFAISCIIMCETRPKHTASDMSYICQM